MAALQDRLSILAELADFLAGGPSANQILKFQPSAEASGRARLLLLRKNEGTATSAELQELSEFEHFEVFMRLLKARLRAAKQ